MHAFHHHLPPCRYGFKRRLMHGLGRLPGAESLLDSAATWEISFLMIDARDGRGRRTWSRQKYLAEWEQALGEYVYPPWPSTWLIITATELRGFHIQHWAFWGSTLNRQVSQSGICATAWHENVNSCRLICFS